MFYKQQARQAYGSGYSIKRYGSGGKKGSKLRRQKRRLRKFSEKCYHERVRSATTAELIFKRELEAVKARFEFQYVIRGPDGFRIADFYLFRSSRVGIVVEIDGGYHKTDEQKAKDEERTKWIKRNCGAEVIRFTNEQVLHSLKDVMAQLLTKLST